MLINLTNHPSSKWEKKQIEAANNAYGNIRDMAFPNIDHLSSSEEVKQVAHQYVHECLEILKEVEDEDNAIHVMGESNFVYFFVSEMEELGIKCIASTRERIIVDDKVSNFVFSRFREYF